MPGSVHSGAQRTYCQKKRHIRGLVDVVRNAEGHKSCKDKFSIPGKRHKDWASEAAQKIKAFAAKPGVQSSNPRTRMVEGENLFEQTVL